LQKLLRNLLWGFLFLQVLLFSSRRKSSFGHMAITIMGVFRAMITGTIPFQMILQSGLNNQKQKPHNRTNKTYYHC
jgi:hypothetical protein